MVYSPKLLKNTSKVFLLITTICVLSNSYLIYSTVRDSCVIILMCIKKKVVNILNKTYAKGTYTESNI